MLYILRMLTLKAGSESFGKMKKFMEMQMIVS